MSYFNYCSSIKNSYIILVILILIGGCTKDFTETNKDPNRLESITPGTLLNPIIYGAATYGMSRGNSLGFDLMQVAGNYPNVSVEDQVYLYDLREDVGNGLWNSYYNWLANAREMELAAVEDNNANYQAIALTLKAWLYANLTDSFGDIPFTEALSGEEGTFFPKFDSQQLVYETILADLAKADTLYDVSKAMEYAPDLLFKNNVLYWKKFTNSLRLRLLLRISNKADTYAQMAEILNNPAVTPVMESNAESAVLAIDGATPNLSPWSRPQDFNVGRVYFDFFISNLNTFNDPRLPLFAGPARDAANAAIGFKGLPVNYSEPGMTTPFNPSGPLQRLVIAPMIAPVLTYAEVEFIRAELALKGHIGSSAEEHYKKGTQAAIQQWGGVVPATYFDNPFTQFDGTLDRIMLQKYYALFFTDLQQWFEHRRTGLPVLPKNSLMFNSGEIPRRLYYPTTVRTYNTDNYVLAAQQIGGDEINTRVWWEK